MAENSKHAERVALVDKLTPSPEARAMEIFKLLQSHSEKQKEVGGKELDEWDMISFCAEYLVHISEKYTWLQQMAFPLVNFVHNAHYVKGAELGLYEEPKIYDAVGVLTSSKIEQPKIVNVNGQAFEPVRAFESEESKEAAPQGQASDGEGEAKKDNVLILPTDINRH